MTTVAELAAWIEQLAPTELAEEWDNVGLLVGDPEAVVRRAMTCLTITGDSAAEAIARRAELIITHHPLPFRPLRRLTTETPEGRLILDLIAAGVAVYSAHTAFDSAITGINQRLAAGLGLTDLDALIPRAEDPAGLGAGRFGRTAAGATLEDVAQRLKTFLKIPHLQMVGKPDQPVPRVAVACGSGGDFLAAARNHDCNCLVTGETRFHTCLEAEATGVALLLPGHFASERFALECLAGDLRTAFSQLEVWASEDEHDPLTLI